MDIESIHLKIVLILTAGLTLASLFGYLSFRLKLSPILGYLLAGYVIGPHSPGFVADPKVTEQLAEIGVILMLFGVGLHFKWQDLLGVRQIAIPGAVGQTLVAALIGALFVYWVGWSFEAGILFGLAIGVASTVVLVRMLTHNHLLHSQQGHIAVGWLIVEDLITVIILLFLPLLAASLKGGDLSAEWIAKAIGIGFLKFLLLTALMFTVGKRCVRFLLSKMLKADSHELFTLTILALTFLIATGAALLFGTSIALGAFLAGMVINQTDVRHQAASDVTPLKEVFMVIFFVSIGMLFNPQALADHFWFFLGVLAIVLIAKPLAAFLITLGLRHPLQTALTVAVALAQIGEFSFILAEAAVKLKILPLAGYDIIVACSFISISINPLLFKLLKRWAPT